MRIDRGQYTTSVSIASVSSEGPGESVHMHKLPRESAAHINKVYIRPKFFKTCYVYEGTSVLVKVNRCPL